MLKQAIALLLMALATTSAFADDWPQWRGPTRDGVWRESGIVERFDKPKLDIVWRADISSGYSGPTVADNRVYVTDRVVEPKQIERIHCFDAKTGRPIWTHAYDCEYRGVGYEAGPRASVTLDSGKAYALGAMGNLLCLDAKSGTVLWRKDLLKTYSIEMPIWGIAAAPLIEDDLVILHIGGKPDACLVALDKKTGKERWKALDDGASYSAPIIIEHAGRRVLICYTGQHAVGLDPKTGKVHWEHPFPPKRMVIGVASPVHHRDQLFFTNFFDGALMLRLDPGKQTVTEVWQRAGESEMETDGLQSIISTPYLAGDHIYGVDSYGELRCLELETGKRVWEDLSAVPKARWATIHFVKHDDKVWMFNERGELIISRLTPTGFDEISRTKLIDPTLDQLPRRGGVCWAHPALAYKHVFARNDKELLCADLTAK